MHELRQVMSIPCTVLYVMGALEGNVSTAVEL